MNSRRGEQLNGDLKEHPSQAQLLYKSYQSTATHERREYLLYLPTGYEADGDKRWPVMLFLHGGGERGNGLEDLDYVLTHGPLAEAWIQRRDLPFIIIGPQLPVFGMTDQLRSRQDQPKPRRLPSGCPPRSQEDRPARPMVRAPDPTPTIFGRTEDYGDEGIEGGWHLCEQDLLSMVDVTLRDYRADPDRVYLTGLSYGGYGTWSLATAHPERWAAIAPVCGTGSTARAHRLAEVQMPIWIWHGGRDPVVKVQWAYDWAAALEAADHKTVRFTVHEDVGHAVWVRAYAGEDLYQWLLSHRRG